MENIRKLLEHRLNCSSHEAQILCDDLAKIDCTLLPALNKWITEEGDIEETEYNGYSIASLCENYDMNFIAALLTIDWLIKEPKKAITALESGII